MHLKIKTDVPFVFKDFYSWLLGFFLKDPSYVESHFIYLQQTLLQNTGQRFTWNLFCKSATHSYIKTFPKEKP